jgi:hypothetical protein
MDAELDEGLSYDHFTHWSVVALQDYCSKRGFPRTGTLSMVIVVCKLIC